MEKSSAGGGARRADEISGLLVAWSKGDQAALQGVVTVLYPELRRIARRRLARLSEDCSLESAALANEAYLKLSQARGIFCGSRVHFLALSHR